MISSSQRSALRLGAVMILLAGLVSLAVAVFAGGGSAAPPTVVADATRIELPEPGFFGGSVLVYGDVPADADVSSKDLGCALVNERGREQSSAKLSEIAALTADPISIDGKTLQPLFRVKSYARGSRLECSTASSATPMAISGSQSFGGMGLLVRVLAGGFALVCFVFGGVAWVLLRPRRP